MELLVVLSILSLALLLAVPIQFNVLETQSEEAFIEQLKHDILFVQNQVSSDGNRRVYLRFHDDRYEITQMRSHGFQPRYYPKGWSLIQDSERNRNIQFAPTGTLLQPRTLTMYSETERIKIVFPLGKGRFYVEREERILDD